MPSGSAKAITCRNWTRTIFLCRTRSSGSSRRCEKLTASECFFPHRGPPFIIGRGAPASSHNSLCQDLSPVEWLLRKMNDNVHMQNATWLVSRELAEAAGPWDESLHYDQDGEYFARVVLASEGTRFVPGTGVFYRVSSASTRISHIGNSNRKKTRCFSR